jgi:hypothetical protein
MLASDKRRMEAMGQIIYEDIVDCASTRDNVKLDSAWRDFGTAVACVIFSKGEVERTAAIGALFYASAQLPK